VKFFAQLLDSFSIQALTALAVTSLAALGWSAGSAAQGDPVQSPAAPAPAQETRPPREAAPGYRSDAAYAELIEGLEIGMRTLKELGRDDALRVLEQVASDVRAERERARTSRRGPDLDALENRIEILRHARAAHGELGHDEDASYLDRFVQLGELQLQDASQEELERAAEGLTRAHAVKLLQIAADQYRAWGREDRAAACAALAEYYARSESQAQSNTRPVPERAPVPGATPVPEPEVRQRVESLTRQVEELRRALQELQTAIDEVRGRMR
jgi:hypothetical protein